jgi:hypothetical protein
MWSAGCTAGYSIGSNRTFSIRSNVPSNTLQSKALQTIELGWAVPEPVMLVFLCLGSLILQRRK